MTLGPNGQISALSKVRPSGWQLSMVQTPRLLLWKALLGLLLFDVFGFGRNFARMHRYVKQWKTRQRSAPEDTVSHVCAAVNHACVWYPKRVLCLQRSTVTTCLLRHCGVSAQMVMGVQSLPLRAHAWTEVNGCAINERRSVQQVYGVWERC
jgi:Transglutaminase-like superfamily